ncbi:dynein regulatory complex subunit 5-like [Argonauta hians]
MPCQVYDGDGDGGGGGGGEERESFGSIDGAPESLDNIVDTVALEQVVTIQEKEPAPRIKERPPAAPETFVANPAADMRKVRRIIAENTDWSLVTVPQLEDICLKYIVDNFESNCYCFRRLNPEHKASVLRILPVNLPLKVTALLIDQEGYWERCCRNRWSICNVSDYENNWKRMYFERNLERMIEFFVPDQTDDTELDEALKVSSDFVKKLQIKQMLPPVAPEETITDLLEEQSDEYIYQDPMCDHFNMMPVLEQLKSLKELHITFSVRDCGMNFVRSMFHITKKDCEKLAEAVKICTTLRVLHLYRSKLDDEKTRILMYHLLDHPSIEEIDLSHNNIGDHGTKAIGKLICTCDQIKTLNLCNNKVGLIGGQALAHSLLKTEKLETLNLRLNYIGDEGGSCLLKALINNYSLKHLNLAANKLGELTAMALAQLLRSNLILTWIDLSCNDLKKTGGMQIRENLEMNVAVTHLDLRLTNCSQETEFQINQLLEYNQDVQEGRV